MNIKTYLDENFPSVKLVPTIIEQWDIGIHFTLGAGIYQFKENNKLNMERFNIAYKQSLSIFKDLFTQDDDLFLVTNIYRHKEQQYAKKMKVYEPNLRNKNMLQKIKIETSPYLFEIDENDKYEMQQFSFIFNVNLNYNCKVDELSKNNISLSKSDWDSFETSWDFKEHPFIEFKNGATKLEDAFTNWKNEAEHRFQTSKANEEELNRIFIDLYGLQDELTPDVEDKDVTVNRADRERDVKSFLSYLVGIMFGRYSLDEKGLSFAGGDFDTSRYKTFTPDIDNIIPITDEMYFEDDIVGRTIELIKPVFGEEYVEENLEFIADTLTRRRNETARERIRRCFLKEFYKDHVRIYQKRPIYWLIDSGRQDGFKALIYLHRYRFDLLSRDRTQYLHPQIKKYEEEIKRLDLTMQSDVSQAEKARARKKKERIEKQIIECQNYDQVIAHMANQQIELDLDDGVKVNYEKFQGVTVPQGNGTKTVKANVFARL